MSRYQSAIAAGSSYFFTVVACRWQSILCDEAIRNALCASIETVSVARPFVIDAWVYMHDRAVVMESEVLGYDRRCPRGHKDVPTLLSYLADAAHI